MKLQFFLLELYTLIKETREVQPPWPLLVSFLLPSGLVYSRWYMRSALHAARDKYLCVLQCLLKYY